VAIRPPAEDQIGREADAEKTRLWLRDVLPDYSTDRADLARIWREPGNIVRLDDAAGGAVCWLAVNLPTRTSPGGDVQIVMLLPQKAGAMPILQPLLKACLIRAGDVYPEALDWPVWAQFEPGQSGLRKVLTWALVFPAAETGVTGSGFNYIRLPRLRDAIAVVETWLN
jgi:hypothetical protein